MFKASPSMTATKPIHSDSSQESDFGIEPKSIQKKVKLTVQILHSQESDLIWRDWMGKEYSKQ